MTVGLGCKQVVHTLVDLCLCGHPALVLETQQLVVVMLVLGALLLFVLLALPAHTVARGQNIVKICDPMYMRVSIDEIG